MTPDAALIIGVIAGAIAYYGVILMEKLRIDDPVGAFPVHGINGMFGMLAVGIWGWMVSACFTAAAWRNWASRRSA